MDMVKYTFNLSIQKTEADLCEFKANLVYIVGSKTELYKEILRLKINK